jgi:sialic acid synthase SpsE
VAAEQQKMNSLRIANRAVGGGQPVFIKLVDAAVEAGADAIKFQTFRAQDIATPSAAMADYQSRNTGKKESQYEMLRRLELAKQDHTTLRDYCAKKGIIFASTPHSSNADADLLEQLGVHFFKVGSGDLTNLPFIDYIARKNKPVIFSTGMGLLEECADALEAIRNAGNNKAIMLHCTTSYPCQDAQANLRAILTLRSKFNTLVGYSDHTAGIAASIIAASLGACVIEKHFTLDKGLPGPDHKASLEPHEFALMVKAVRVAEKAHSPEEAIQCANDALGLKLAPDIQSMLGHGEKKPYPEELAMAPAVRKSIVAARDIPSGTIITLSDIAFKRPGNGLSPKLAYGKHNIVIGKRTLVPINKDQPLLSNMFV